MIDLNAILDPILERCLALADGNPELASGWAYEELNSLAEAGDSAVRAALREWAVAGVTEWLVARPDLRAAPMRLLVAEYEREHRQARA